MTRYYGKKNVLVALTPSHGSTFYQYVVFDNGDVAHVGSGSSSHPLSTSQLDKTAKSKYDDWVKREKLMREAELRRFRGVHEEEDIEGKESKAAQKGTHRGR